MLSVSVSALSVECHLFILKTKDIRLVFAASQLSTKHLGVEAKTGWRSQNNLVKLYDFLRTVAFGSKQVYYPLEFRQYELVYLVCNNSR